MGLFMKKFVLFLLIFLLSYNLYSAKKVDVMDALLQSVIDYFSTKTPKFVDRYGADRFVADEPMTRGTILLLLYEYDQYLKTQQTIPDLSSIQKRIETIEKKLTSIEKQTSTAQPAKIDIFEIMKELTPNMPVLLDSTLTKSQVFNNLKKEIDELKQTAKLPQQPQQPQVLPSDISLKIDKLEKDYAVIENLKKELESLKVAQQQQQTLLSKSQQPQQQAASVQPEVSLQINNLNVKMKDFEEKINNLSTQQQNLLLELKKDIDALKTNVAVKTDIDKLQKNYSKLSVKFEEIEKQLSEKKEFTPQYYKKEEGSTYLSFLTKFSLGLSFLTLLFIAR